MRIGILGGSFDPIHQGHLTLARESMKQFKLDKVLFIPASVPPHKKNDPSVTPAPFRARMTELAVVEEPRWEVSDLELRRSGVSYTVDTLRELRKIYPPPHELFFIAGADSLQDLAKWKDPDEILKLSEWIVAPRASITLPAPMPAKVHLLKIPLVEVSATELRDKIRRGEDVSQWIPERVSRYVRERKVYSGRGM